MSHVDFNTLSQLGLIWKINKDILHPLGLALTRDPETGVSIGALVSDDGVWSFSEKSDFENIAKQTLCFTGRRKAVRVPTTKRERVIYYEW